MATASPTSTPPAAAGNGSDLDFERELFAAADKLRSNMDAAEYKHVVLGLIFLKYISDAFEEHHAALKAAVDNPKSDLTCPPQPDPPSGSVYRGWTKEGTFDGKSAIQRGADHSQVA